MENLVEGTNYYVNGTKRILYWDGEKWMKPVRDSRKQYSGLLTNLESQPKVISVTEIKDIEKL